jgi:hypothetical protein
MPTLEQEATREGQREIMRAVDSVEDALRDGLLGPPLAAGHIGKLRALMEQLLRSTGKFPDFFEVGINVFLESCTTDTSDTGSNSS